MSRTQWVLLAVLVAIAVWLLRKRSAATAVAAVNPTTGMTPQQEQETLRIINGYADPDRGFSSAGTHTLRPAGADYPGYYITDDGGFVNPETGETYSPGSYPVAFRPGPAVVIDLSKAPIQHSTGGEDIIIY